MKKALRITLRTLGILLLVVLILLITLPFILKSKLGTIAKNVINENVEAVVDFKDLKVSLIRDFPNIRLSLKDLSVVGKDKFAGDTLAKIESFDVTINIMSYFKKDEIDVRRVILDKPFVHALVLKDNSANWNIMKSDTTAMRLQEPAKEGGSKFKMSLHHVEVKNGNVIYEDRTFPLVAAIRNLNAGIKGDMTGGKTRLDLTGSIENFTFIWDGATYISNLAIGVRSKIDADIDSSIYRVTDGDLSFNGMDLLVNGSVVMPHDDIDVDMTYALKAPSVASLLAMIPAEYMKKVKVDTKGDIALSGWVKGTYNDKLMPVVGLDLKLKDGYIKYQGFDQSINDLNVDLEAIIDRQHDNVSKVALNSASFVVAGNPFKLHTVVTSLFSDPDITAGANGKIDFASLKAAFPMPDSIKLDGVATVAIDFASRMSYIEKEQYEKIKLEGTLGLANMQVKLSDMPNINISKTELSFTPAKVDLRAFDATVGKSDFHMVGTLDNLLNYVLKNQTIRGNMLFTSNLIDCNELMGSSKTEQQATTTEQPMSVFVIPRNIDFTLKSMVKRIVFDKLDMTNVGGTITVRDGKLIMNNLAMNAMGGNMDVSGDYFAADASGAMTDLTLKIRGVEISNLARTFVFVDTLLPIAKNMSGRVALNIAMGLPLKSDMMPNIDRLNAVGKFSADSLAFLNSEAISTISDLLKIAKINNVVRHVEVDFTIKNGMVQVPPFTVRLGNVPVTIGGQHGISSMEYHADFTIPTGSVGAKANEELSSVLAKAGIGSIPINLSNIPIGIAITGTMQKPHFALAKPMYTSGQKETPAVQEQVKDVVKQQIEEKKEEVKHQADSIIKEKKEEAVEKVKEQMNKLFQKKP